MGSKELAEKLERLSRRHASNAYEIQILDICRKMNVKPRVNMGFKELAEKLNYIRHKKLPLSGNEKQILDVCRKINTKPRAIMQWLECISVSPVIQNIEIGNLKGVGEKI